MIGHDIDMLTAPPGCAFEGPGPPYNVLHCPARGIGRISVSLGNGKDSVQTRNVIYYVGFGAPKSFLPPDLVGVDVEYGPSDDVMDQETPAPLAWPQ